MRHFLRELPAAVAGLPLYAKMLLAFVAASLLVFLTLPPDPDHGRSRQTRQSSDAQQIAPPIEPVAPTLEPMQVKTGAKAEDAQAQSHLTELIKVERPEVRSNGVIRNGDTEIVLSEVTRFTSKDVCNRRSGQKWACGLQAYATLHNMVAGHAIDCIPREMQGKNTVASCRVGSQNLAAELLKKGLVKLQPHVSDSELQEAEEYAKSKHIGVWQ